MHRPASERVQAFHEECGRKPSPADLVVKVPLVLLHADLGQFNSKLIVRLAFAP